ncbi:MAG: CoA-binding protein [Anaerolineae bacterium]|nr:CoA-binding protein [Anaerolineae bacterium]
MPPTLAEKVEDFLSHNRIAVAGVSRDGKATGNAIYKRFKERGYEVFAVNPNADEIDGERCYRSLKAIPGGVDGVIVVTRPEATEQVVRDCADAGIQQVWMHEAFHGGRSVSQSAVEFCQQHNITVIAGACPLMFGKPSDGFHRLFRRWIQLTGKLPA